MRVREGSPRDVPQLREIQTQALAEPWPELLDSALSGPLEVYVLDDDGPVPIDLVSTVHRQHRRVVDDDIRTCRHTRRDRPALTKNSGPCFCLCSPRRLCAWVHAVCESGRSDLTGPLVFQAVKHGLGRYHVPVATTVYEYGTPFWYWRLEPR